MARARSLFPMLSVADLDASLKLYGDLLGGVESYRFPETGSPAFIVLKIGSSEIGLGVTTSAVGPIHEQPIRPATGHRIELCVQVDDVDATVDQIRAAGFSIVVEPVDQPWGERIAYVVDADGNLLMLTA